MTSAPRPDDGAPAPDGAAAPARDSVGAALDALLNAFPDIQRLKTDVFRDRVRYAPDLALRLAAARAEGAAAVAALAPEVLARGAQEPAALVDLLLSQRAVRDWPAMIALVALLPAALRHSTLVQEQLGLALNRAGRHGEAQAVLEAVIARHGPSSETCALLGRVHKDRYEAAVRAGDAARAADCLRRAIAAYVQGFECDPRDAFPGINALTLMTLQQPPDVRRDALRPAVQAAVEARLRASTPDYWDHATRVELAVLADDEAAAHAALPDALASVRESWEPESTARNLALIRAARAVRGEATPDWATRTEAALSAAASGRSAGPTPDPRR